ncbi:response regulator [Mahella sp.]|uniref:response regulator transcription factor n=1 Tax=Mahella sp. TaxID=2798721 RepID=UPI0025B991CF|nr:response regulator [Mahella sp.]MBZ4665444.1 two component transcriptional regulator, AraC family [Mahella sp.]
MIHVLIVDDDKLARKGLISMMPWEFYGMEVVGDVPNGARALEFLKNNVVDLMFVDLAMPVMSGIELMREVRKSYPDINFVVLTFHENFEYVQEALRFGVLDYISKAELEAENYGQIFNRIIRKLKGEKQYILPGGQGSRVFGYDQEPETEINEEIWEGIKQDWYKLYWLYDDDVFAELCLQLKENRIPMRRVEQLFIKLMVMVESATGIKEESLPDARCIDAAIEWMKCYKEDVICKAVQASDLTAMPVCILKAVAFIKENISTPIREEDVAYRVNMSRSYFSQNFRKITGLTFNDYIKKQRVNMAKKLLTDSNRTVADIAQTVGYEDVKYFSRVFYEQVHVSPSHFRQQLSTNSNDC